MSSQQQAILAEAWTLTPQRSAQAGFTGLPLRNCEGLYCGVLSKMPIGTQVDVLVDDQEGWGLVHAQDRESGRPEDKQRQDNAATAGHLAPERIGIRSG